MSKRPASVADRLANLESAMTQFYMAGGIDPQQVSVLATRIGVLERKVATLERERATAATAEPAAAPPAKPAKRNGAAAARQRPCWPT